MDLLEAHPPSKALTLICRRLHRETATIYKTAYRSFWQDTGFTIDLFHCCTPLSALQSYAAHKKRNANMQKKLCSMIEHMDDEDVAHIANVHVCCNNKAWEGRASFTLGKYGVW